MFSSNIGFGFSAIGRIRSTVAAIGLLCLGGAMARAGAPDERAGMLSPRPEEVSPSDTWRLAEMAAAERPGTEIFIGSGGSMAPLYPDRTVVVVEAMDMSDLRPGMTVVFYSDRGRLVAHTLVTKTARGWVARGIANAGVDDTLVKSRNYVGTVVRAFAPNPSIAALPRLELPPADSRRDIVAGSDRRAE